ncbi:hypothetical protein RhiirA4_483605 [Rhizophagus irregularis]|uniref:Uncharacterized protein n=1 Tax=Rhizophagus irregularis TaxID=588596 RepID=A0A2I1HMU7_9GLOM|nr:hypothetical protein RhiirA4_483605 [Rhizophagus irregularis]
MEISSSAQSSNKNLPLLKFSGLKTKAFGEILINSTPNPFFLAISISYKLYGVYISIIYI